MFVLFDDTFCFSLNDSIFCFVFFFFFKQKTAYEMRISDWSSDVCSSDLAFEIGTKNSFDGGRFTLNATAFYYDYKDYQISQIVDRIAYNENFDATSYGLELEAAWRPSRAIRVDANLGYLRTRLKNGSESIDVMNRTQGNPDWVLLRPWLQAPSNCVAPRVLVERILANTARASSHTIGREHV